ncbi:MAG: IS1182 family transposase [candidate division NC10 bacterium]
MSGFRTPEIPREQMVLWERRLEDAVPEDHQVRHLVFLLCSAAFADTFREMEQSYVLVRGKPPYHPRDLAGLYLYGMLHRLRSSRQLEDACYSRLDVIWLMQGQTPDHSTIADFVGHHGKLLRKLFRNTLRVLIKANLVTLSHVAIDGSKVEADAGKNSVRGEEKIRSWQTHLDEKIAALEQEWAENEKREASLFGQSNPWTNAPGKDAKKDLAQLKRKRDRLKQALAQLERRQEGHVGSKPPKRIASTTDPDARSMKDKEGRSKPNFNTQIGVDDACGAIVAADVNDEPDDSGQLTPMVEQVVENCGAKPGSVSADSQYNTGPDLAAMEEQGIDCYLPDAGQNSEAAPRAEAAQEAQGRAREGRALSESQWEALPRNTRGLIDKSSFTYDETKDEYLCPAGQPLVFLRKSQDKKKWGTAQRKQYGGCAACAGCAHAKLCCKNSDKGRLVSRDQYEDHRERLRRRMATEDGREIYKRRKYTVEPRIGHIKHNMGVRRFLRRGIEKVKTEWTMACTVVNLGILLRHWDTVVTTL